MLLSRWGQCIRASLKETQMSLFKTIEPMLAAGAVLKMKLSAVAGGKIQLDLIPEVDTKATGIMIPSQSLTATAEEFDNELGQHLAGLVSGTVSLSNQAAVAAAVMEEAKAKAAEAVKNAAKNPAKTTAKPATASTTAARSKPSNAGLSLDDDEGDEGVSGGKPEAQATSAAAPAASTKADDGVIELF